MVWGSTPQLSAIFFMYKKQISFNKYKKTVFVDPKENITQEDLSIISEEFALLFYYQGFKEVTVAAWLDEDNVLVKIEA